MATKLRYKLLKSPFLWIGIVLLSFIIFFSYQKKEQLEDETEKNIQLMVRNISSNNIDIAKGIFYHYKDQLEHISYVYLQSDSVLHSFIIKDSLYSNITVIDSPIDAANIGISVHFDDKLGYIQYITPIKNKVNGNSLSLQIPLDKLHDIIANNSSFSYSYVTIIKDNRYLYHPEEQKIGSLVEDHVLSTIDKLDEKTIFDMFSDYLNIPIYSYFEIVDIDGDEWYFTSNTPGISFDDLIYNVRNAFLYISLTASLAFVFIFLLGFLLWKKEFVKKQSLEHEKVSLELLNEQHKQQMLANELEQLKSGLNPHFLFNSLSSLRILVTKKPDEAKTFATSLSNLYRYFLKQESLDLTSLKEELDFTKDYIYLQRIRFADRIVVDIDIDDNLLSRKVPPVSLQLLVENCIKHTKISLSNPLQIRIFSKDNYIIVINNYNPIDITSPSGKGLSNLTKRYSFLTSNPCSFFVDNNEFVSKMPLL